MYGTDSDRPASPTRTGRASSNPPPLPGLHPEFWYSYHPVDDLSVTVDGRLIIQPAKDLILKGLHGVYEEKGTLHAEDLRRIIEDRCKRRLIPDQDSYSYQYRAADKAGPAQFLDRWTRATVVFDQVEFDADREGMIAFFENLAWSIKPTDSMIAAAEKRSGNKLTHRPSEA